MGGMRALEWAVSFPDRVAGLGVVASTAAASADQIGFSMPQLEAIRLDPGWRGGDYHEEPAGQGPHRGMGIARRIAHLTYRSAVELDERFGRAPQMPTPDPLDGGTWQVASYLDHHAAKLAHRFDAGSYVALTEAMNSHDVGRDRGGIEAALDRVTARTVVAGVDSDRLYPLSQQDTIAAGVPTSGPTVRISSPYGHDAFLLETAQIAAALEPLFYDKWD
jgi:homoserine O-acetyltransferase